MINDPKLNWSQAEWWVRLYSYITIGGVIYGLGAAHLPFIMGISWSACEAGGSKLACVLALHLYEAPLTLFNAFIAWYGLRRFSRETIQNFASLLTFAVVGNVVFFTFECQLIVDILRRSASQWEPLVTSSIALMLIAGAGLGVYVKQKLITFAYQDKKS
jgi:hypothetical protein